jgi:CBS domain-containing protein
MLVLEAAELLFEHDCGAIPVVENVSTRHPVGILTDRDIACRCVAKGLLPNETEVRECMTSLPLTVHEDATIDDCIVAMETLQVPRVVIVDSAGACCGIVSQADVARHVSERAAGEILKKVSESRLLSAAGR